MNLHGLHHVTAITGDTRKNLSFYTEVLGLRLVKKTVNQDDVGAYHLFYADRIGSPGTDITFFDWPQAGPNRPGVDTISRTFFRVLDRNALDFWEERFREQDVPHERVDRLFDLPTILFSDHEGQALGLVADDREPLEDEPWDAAGVSSDNALRGFHSVELTVQQVEQVEPVLTQLLNMTRRDADDGPVFSMDGGGPGREVRIRLAPDAPRGYQGRGGVHHVAFRLHDSGEQGEWLDRLESMGVSNSGVVDRFYFKSLYFRISRGILFELATDGPGFAVDEEAGSLGRKLALPPFLESRRAAIEAGLRPLES